MFVSIEGKLLPRKSQVLRMDEHNDTRTKLMTLLNVSHLRASKRKIDLSTSSPSSAAPEKRAKLNKKRVQAVAHSAASSAEDRLPEPDAKAVKNMVAADSVDNAGLYYSTIARLAYT